MAAPIAKRSCAGPGRSASAPPSATACGCGTFSSMTRAGRSSSSRDPNGTCASDSMPRARSNRIPVLPAPSPVPAARAAWSSSAVLPIPGSPTSAITALAPDRALARAFSMASRSRSRPSSMRRF